MEGKAPVEESKSQIFSPFHSVLFFSVVGFFLAVESSLDFFYYYYYYY